MTITEILERYQGRELTESDLSSYEQWSLDFFHQPHIVREPYLQMTLQLDITEALKAYKEQFSENKNASFSAYLMWHLVQTQKAHPYFRYRKMDGKWYIFDNLPVYAPIAIGGDKRFSDMLLEDVVNLDIEAFFEYYRNTVSSILAGGKLPAPAQEVWAITHFIGNLPNLQFTGLTVHLSASVSARPYFYFGKRYEQEGKTLIPLLITFDHSNLDPFVISGFMADFEENITMPQTVLV